MLKWNGVGIMSKFKLIFQIVFMAILFVNSASLAVVNGAFFENTNNESVMASSLVSLSFKVEGLPAMPCSGSYVGKGQVLTASHCFLMNDYPDYRPELCILGADVAEFCLSNTDYEVLFPSKLEEGPKAPTRKLRKVIKIPRPDMVLVQFEVSKLAQEKSFQVIPMITDSKPLFSEPLDWKIFILGLGCTEYTEPGAAVAMPGLGQARSGSVVIASDLITDLELNSVWNKTNSNSGLCWGDSGGPLVALNIKTNQFYQWAVNSSTKRTYDRNTGYTESVKSIYSRVDNQSNIEWLKKNLR
jgi:hypothetical protein